MAELRFEPESTARRRIAAASKNVLRKFVPEFLLKQRSIIQRLGPRGGRIYAALRLLDAIGVRASNRGVVPAASRSLVFVCFGNIMRSPMAEALMKQALTEAGMEQQITVASAGLHAVPGREAHPWALEAAAGMGISLIDHRARALSGEMVGRSDCIFAMDFQNKAELLTLYPEAQHKIYMLSAYAEGQRRYREIPDPYLGNVDTTKSCYEDLQTCIRNLMASTFSVSRKEQKRTELPRR